MTTAEYIELRERMLVTYQKQARRYNKLSMSYLEKYKHQSELCNRLMREIDNLKNKLEQENIKETS